MSPRTGLDAVEKRRISCPLPGMETRQYSPQPVSIPTELSQIPIPNQYTNKSHFTNLKLLVLVHHTIANMYMSHWTVLNIVIAISRA
jgi:hypothetical protein